MTESKRRACFVRKTPHPNDPPHNSVRRSACRAACGLPCVFRQRSSKEKQDGMIVKRDHKLILAVIATIGLTMATVAAAGGFPNGLSEALGPNFSAARRIYLHPRHHPDNAVARWNEIAINATGLDHTPVAPGEHRVFGEQFGPTRASRAMAIVHIAMFDAADAIHPKYQSYTDISHAPHDTSVDAAVAQAAHDTLAALYPSQAPSFDLLLAADLGHINDHGKGKAN